MVEIELLPLRATSLFSKVPSQAGDGYQICLKGGSGGLHPSPLQILYPPPPPPRSTLETKMPPVGKALDLGDITEK